MNHTSRTLATSKLTAPKRIIRSVEAYAARTKKELSFEKGEFFHVTNYENDATWYEVNNPLTGKSGLVPVSYFEIMESRQERMRQIQRSSSSISVIPQQLNTSQSQPQTQQMNTTSRSSLGIPHNDSGNTIPNSTRVNSQDSSLSTQRRPSEGGATLVEAVSGLTSHSRIPSNPHQRHPNHINVNGGTVCSPSPIFTQPRATAMYDFEAVSTEELSVHAEEPLIILAQSTEEWFVAKPVMRAGAPGLVPVSYVQLYDPKTDAPVDDIQVYLKNGSIHIPSVAEWKKNCLASRSSHSSETVSSDAITNSNSLNTGNISTASNCFSTAADSIGHNKQYSTVLSEATNTSGGGNRESGLGQWPPALKTRTRTRTASSSTSSIAERSSMRPFHKGRQASASSLQHLANDNFPPFRRAEVQTVGVPSFICKDGAYLFLVFLKFKSGDERHLYRSYEDFVYFQIGLTDEFPEEMSSLKTPKFLTHTTSVSYLNDGIAERRRCEIDEHVQNLLALSHQIIDCNTYQRFFGSSTGPIKGQHTPSTSMDSGAETFVSASTSFSSKTMSEIGIPVISPSESAGSYVEKNKSDSNRIKSNDGAFSMPTPEKPAVSTRRGDCAIPETPARSPPRIIHKSSTLALVGNVAMVKVKVKLGDDMMALRIPSTLSVDELKARITEKLGQDHIDSMQLSMLNISYCTPDGESNPLSVDEDWRAALQLTNNKPVLAIVR